MKKLSTSIFAVPVLLLFAIPAAVAQGTFTYLSALNKPSGGSLAVASNAWWGQGFGTGTNALGYTLDSVQLLMADGSGMPSGFAVSLYTSDAQFAFSVNKLWTLTGSMEPMVAGVYNYSGSGIILLPSTGYFVVVTASQPLVSGSYRWAYLAGGATVDATGGWGLGHFVSSVDGSAWGRSGTINPFQFAILPGTSQYVAVRTVNGGCVNPSYSAVSPEYYVDNADPRYSALPEYAAPAPVYDLQYDGFTVLLTAQASLSANTSYHLKIAIADATDRRYDSAVFIKAQVPCP